MDRVQYQGVRNDVKEIIHYAARAFRIVWSTAPVLAASTTLITFAIGFLPLATAYVASLLIDTITNSSKHSHSSADESFVLFLVILEASLILGSSLIGKINGHFSTLLQNQIYERTQLEILEKASSAEYFHFENPEFNDRIHRACDNPTKPLGSVNLWMGTVQTIITLIASISVLWTFSSTIIAMVVVSAIPGFFINIWSGKHYHEIQMRRSPEIRRQHYIRSILISAKNMKEVRCFGFAQHFIEEYRQKVRSIASQNRRIAIEQSLIGTFVELLSTGVLYFAYASVALSAVRGDISVGQMTMYLALFRQGQGSISGILGSMSGLYNDRIQLKPLLSFLDFTPTLSGGNETSGPLPGDGIRFLSVSYHYPNIDKPAINRVDLHIRPGEAIALVGDNGAGKSTFVKLIMRLYLPTEGIITLDGLDLNLWDEAALRTRMTALFQDYGSYFLSAGENIGLGDGAEIHNEQRWIAAAESGLAEDVIAQLPNKYQTLLGTDFGGQDLSGGQWQRLSLARAYMKTSADIIILDEPASAVDALTEVRLLKQFKYIIDGRMAILISHRFSTVRLADRIIVLHHGRIIEDGCHDALITEGGHYASMYLSQAEGYK